MKQILQDFRLATPTWVLVTFGIIAASNLLGMLLVGTHTDEAYYWLWSERLDLGYYDHPPMIAWVIRPFTELFGVNPFAIRLPAIISWALVMAATYRLGRLVFPGSPMTAALSVLVLAIGPLFQFGAHIITPDVPLMLFSTLALLYFYQALESNRVSLWLLAGVFVGASALSKYNAILIPLALLPVMVVTTGGREAWRSPGLWLAILVAAAVSSPVFIWNHLNDWISIKYQLGHGTSIDHRNPARLLGLYISGQMANTVPWLFLLMLYSVFYAFRNLRPGNAMGFWFLSFSFIVPLVFFGVLGTFSKSEPNWPAMAYVPASLLVGSMFSGWLSSCRARLQGAIKYLLIFTAVFSLLLVNLVRYPGWAWWFEDQLIPNDTQIANIYGWEKFQAALLDADKMANEFYPGKGDCTYLTRDHLLAGQIAFQLGSADRLSFLAGNRVTQFNVWLEKGEIKGPESACFYVEAGGDVKEGSIIEVADMKWKYLSKTKVVPPDRSVRFYNVYRRMGGD